MELRLIHLLGIVLALSAISFGLGRCSKSDKPAKALSPITSHYKDSVNAVIQNLEANLMAKAEEAEREKSKADSFQSLKPQLVYKYIQAKGRRSEISKDSVNNVEIFDELAGTCDSLLAVNDSIIKHSETRDTALLTVISIQHDQLALKDSIIDHQEKILEAAQKDLDRSNKKVRRNRVVAGITSVLAAVGLIL